jgi:phosphoenolpyruvate carboxylase
MKQELQLNLFKQEVETKYRIYNALFMQLPYEKMNNIGSLLPFLYSEAKEGFEQGKSPKEIINSFFVRYTNLNELEKNDLLFRLIQYVERQVVLFDSVEDAAFSELNSHQTSGTLSNIYQLAKRENKLDLVREKLQNFSVRLVFTAHPTQFYPNSVLRIMQDLREAITKSDIVSIDKILQQLGKTPFYKKEKPSPVDEAMSIIYYLRNVYYPCIGNLIQDVQSIFFTDDEQFCNPTLLQLGFWPGGDRDGNPFVTAQVTKKVADELRFSILKCYYKDIRSLQRKLTFRGVEEPLSDLAFLVYQNMFGLSHNLTTEKLDDSLNEIRKNLIEQHNGLFLNELDSFVIKVKAFGLHFATLDIRQDSRIHTQVIEAILKKYTPFEEDYAQLLIDRKLEIISNLNLKIKINPLDFPEGIVRDTIETIVQIKSIQEINGEKSIHRYIISNCETIVDVLHVYVLFKWCGYKENEINIDIVPLFETLLGLSSAENTMQDLYKHEMYKTHLHQRKNTQTIMLGFSDGTKDGGYLKANWEIFQTKEVLTQISRNNNIKVLFFDGRGGPPARGGGKTHRFYASQGKTIASDEIQLTIQGQTITSLYGTEEQTYSNLEQLLSAGVMCDIFDSPENNLNVTQRKLLNELSNSALHKYEALKSHPKFVSYLEKMSTLPYYGKTNIGSRPSKRSSGKELLLEDLRAIPFVGSWSQLKQNVPGYFGLGTAISQMKEMGKLHEVCALYKESAFFKALILNSMMAMTKTYFPLTSYMQNNAEYGDFWTILHHEFQLSVEMALLISDSQELMQEELLSKESIKMREEIVLPLLCIQQYALQNIQENTNDLEMFEKMVTRSLFGNINASRNSA